MAFSYDPKAAADCLPAGKYDAILTSVQEARSKAGNDMLAVIWTIPWNGRDWKIRDFIVNPSTLFKLKNIAKAWELVCEFDDGSFDLEEHVNEAIELELEVKNSLAYGDQNNITGYGSTTGPPPALAAGPPAGADSDIPF